ncbi:hypothetical protein ACN38_g11816 [Penicillium nordicum]|uniref:Uncharacterized protein n=1 Tax=Penicillium nordicum TaxID=229535 RepID=A0A0M9WAE4_9EURO|nr:hypothetical protein ACN38_g11816 [Penicillium nordicum]
MHDACGQLDGELGDWDQASAATPKWSMAPIREKHLFFIFEKKEKKRKRKKENCQQQAYDESKSFPQYWN